MAAEGSRRVPRWLVFWAAVAFGFAALPAAALQVLHKGNGTEPQSLDPHRSQGVPAGNIQRDLFEGLISEAANGDLIPGVAQRWETSADGRVYTFYLRKTARWSNGDPVTAADFVFSWRRLVDPATGSAYAQILSPIVNAQAVVQGRKPPEALGVEAVDTHILQVHLNGPTPYFLGLLTHSTTYPVHAASLEAHGERFTRPGHLISNGAYRLAEWVVQSHIRLVRNRYYWQNDTVRIDEVYYYPTEDQSSELKRYRAGELDMTHTVPLNQLQWIRTHLAGQLHISPYLGTYYYGFNLARPPFKDNVQLRQALAMAIDREVITEKITAAGEIPAYGWVPPGVARYDSQSFPWRHLDRKARIAEARRLYRAAGFGPDRPLVLELRYNTSENHKKIALAVSAMWKQVLGVQTRLLNEEWKVFLANRRQGNTELFRAGWIADYNDAYSFAELMLSQHGINDTGYASPEYDRLVNASAVEADPEKRQRLLQQAERTMLADYPIIPVFFYVTKRLVKPRVGGYEDNIMDHHYTRHLYLKRE